jgi:glutathione-regulated potassium-efflux system protein KefB
VRAYDRGHALDLIQVGVDYQIRETFESALALSSAVLRDLDVPEDEVAEVMADVRRRDEERFELQLAASDVTAGNNLLLGNAPKPAPLTTPKRPSQVIGNVPATAGASSGVSGEA